MKRMREGPGPLTKQEVDIELDLNQIRMQKEAEGGSLEEEFLQVHLQPETSSSLIKN